jgi:hypothetical protein
MRGSLLQVVIPVVRAWTGQDARVHAEGGGHQSRKARRTDSNPTRCFLTMAVPRRAAATQGSGFRCVSRFDRLPFAAGCVRPAP